MPGRTLLCVLACVMFISVPVFAQQSDNSSEIHTIMDILEKTEVSGQIFIAFENEDSESGSSSQFFINRGYINIKSKLNNTISVRITPDISVDRDGDGEGDLELRLKYAYVKAKLPELLVFSQPNIEFGLSSRPLLNFEQSVNRYRVEGQMYLERNEIINTADFGASFNTNIGGELDGDYKKHVSSKYPGRYGSFSLGVYNGGGYHAIEKNQNKTLETRLTIRPLPGIVPGLQFTYGGAFGKGNTDQNKEFTMNTGYVTWESEYVRIVGQYYQGKGNYKGKPLTETEDPEEYKGYAAFADINIPGTPIFVFGQYSQMESETLDITPLTRSIIGGISYTFLKKNRLLLSTNRSCYPDLDIKKDIIYKLSVEVNF